MSSVVQGEDSCPDCGHGWDLHPWSIRISVCAHCIAEEDYAERDEADMCRRLAPGTEHRRANHWSTAKIERPVLRASRVVVTDDRGNFRRRIRAESPVTDIETLLARTEQDLRVLSAKEFDARYQRRG